jgi:toxin secretion/phage lysis holin
MSSNVSHVNQAASTCRLNSYCLHGGISKSMEKVRMLMIQAMHDDIFRLLLVLVIADLIFGGFRAIREKRFNSTTGIDGVIRKSAMLVAMVFFGLVDLTLKWNFIGMIPDKILAVLPVQNVGSMALIGIYLCMYEALSVLKNMSLSGLPLQPVWKRLSSWLEKNTDEISKEVTKEVRYDEDDN